jgi:hypothetical protein
LRPKSVGLFIANARLRPSGLRQAGVEPAGMMTGSRRRFCGRSRSLRKGDGTGTPHPAAAFALPLRCFTNGAENNVTGSCSQSAPHLRSAGDFKRERQALPASAALGFVKRPRDARADSGQVYS